MRVEHRFGTALGIALLVAASTVPPAWAQDAATPLANGVASTHPSDPQPGSSRPHIDPGVYARFEDFHSPFARVAEMVSPAVVFVEVHKSSAVRRRSRGPFEDFFHDFMPRNRGPREMPSSGSGFVMSERGHIMTNNHVIDGADELTATFLNGESYACEIVGQDPRTDVAVIRIIEPSRDGKPFPALMIGDSDEILIGDWAIAVGNPFGSQLAGTVTVGVVSAKGRSDLNIMGAEIDLQDFIQTDASINFGNSGGPLVNIRAEVIGINSALNTQGQGIGFAIPINLAAYVAHQLIAHGRVRRAFLGVRPVELTRELAEGKDWDVLSGILITDVIEGSPAEKAGLRPNDVILEYEGRPVTQATQFRILVAGTDVGKSVELKVYRDGKYLDLEVTLSELDEETLARGQRPAPENWLGIRVQDVGSKPVRERFGLLDEDHGVVITEVEQDGPAAEKGLEPGSVILEIINREIGGLSDYNRIREDLQDRRKPITLKIKEGGTVRYVALTPRP
ncbi:MAG: trypsin-like peptidase domain-containing protein [Candidatus Krumholzibacteriia bacterium]